MRKGSLLYFAKEGIYNLVCHGFMSFAAIGITVSCLLIMGTFTLLAVNANAMLEDMERKNQALAFVDETLSLEEAQALEQQIAALSNVRQVEFISREEALVTFQARYADEELYQDLSPEILRHRFSVYPTDISALQSLKEDLEAINGIDEVTVYQDEANGFVTLRNVVSIVCVALVAILLVVSVFIMANTIKLTTFDRRDEIAIMKMVGATNSFIRWPFVFEGFALGLFAAIIGFFTQWGLYDILTDSIAANDTIRIFHLLPFSDVWGYVAGIFLGTGMLVGIGGSLAAIRKFLRV